MCCCSVVIRPMVRSLNQLMVWESLPCKMSEIGSGRPAGSPFSPLLEPELVVPTSNAFRGEDGGGACAIAYSRAWVRLLAPVKRKACSPAEGCHSHGKWLPRTAEVPPFAATSTSTCAASPVSHHAGLLMSSS